MKRKIIKRNDTISIATACFNEEKNIKNTLENWIYYFKYKVKFKKFEIIITDDGSFDKTVEIINKIKKKNKQIKLYRFKKNMGAALAFRNSINLSKNKYVLINDCDNQFPIKNFIKLWEEISKNKTDAVIGSRDRLRDFTLLNLGSLWSGKFLNYIYNTKIDDFNCALKLIKSSVIKKINLEAIGLNYSTDMTAKLIEKNFKISNVKIFHNKNKKRKKFLKIIKDSASRIIFILYLILRLILKKTKIIF